MATAVISVTTLAQRHIWGLRQELFCVIIASVREIIVLAAGAAVAVMLIISWQREVFHPPPRRHIRSRGGPQPDTKAVEMAIASPGSVGRLHCIGRPGYPPWTHGSRPSSHPPS